jgi:hypothetical protein
MGLCIIMWAHNGVPPLVKLGVVGAWAEPAVNAQGGLVDEEAGGFLGDLLKAASDWIKLGSVV